MKRSVAFVALLALLLPCGAVAKIGPCEDYTEIFWSTYDDEWLVWSFIHNTGETIDLSETWWGSFIDQTVSIGDCPPPCSYTAHVVANFFGGNQFMPNVGGQNLVFRHMASGLGGIVMGVEYNGSFRLFDAFKQSWKVIPGWMADTGSLAIGDINSVYVLNMAPGGHIYHFNPATGGWEPFAAPGEIVELSVDRSGVLFGRGLSGLIYRWNGTSWSAWTPALPAMNQFSVNIVEWAAWGGNTALAIANGRLYWFRVGGILPAQWVEVPTTFTPVEIKAASNSAVARDSSGNMWILTSLSCIDAGWCTALTSTWNQTAQLPAGVAHLALGGPSDIYAFGPSLNVHRFFPNSTVAVSRNAGRYDYAYSGENFAGVLPANLPNGMDFRSSGSSKVIERCAPWPATTILDTFFDRFFLNAYTRVHWLGTNSGCQPGWPDPNIRFCQYNVESWCTPETTPPNFNPSEVRDLESPPPLGYWETSALCFRVLTACFKNRFGLTSGTYV
ncbi:MAG: hypothetical protein ACE14L_10555 [Terriglobales bacterium]